MAVIVAVSEAIGIESDTLDPLYDTVDPDALDDMFRPPNGDVRVSFSYCGCTVAVEDETVVVEPRDGQPFQST